MSLIFDGEAEAVVLGSMFGPGTSKAHVAHCIEVLDASDFDPVNRVVFAAIKESFLEGEPLDHHLTVLHRLRRMNELESVGGSDYLVELMHYASSNACAKHHLHTIKWAARLRDWQRLSLEDVTSEKDAERLAAEAHEILTELKSGKVNLPSPIEAEIEDELDVLSDPDHAAPGLPSGLDKFDDVTGGFRPGQYVIVGARTSLGKTSLLVQLAVAAARAEAKVLFLSLEMPVRQVVHRVLAQQAEVPVQHLTNPRHLGIDGWKKLDGAREKFPTGIWIADGAFSIDDLVAKVRRAQAQVGPLDVVVVDYIQLVRGRPSKNRTEEIGTVSRSLKLLSHELNLCVLAASQLSRQHEYDKREPRLSDLRESGQLEHDADVVVLIHRPEPDPSEIQLQNLIGSELIVAKNRNGRIGKAPVYFDAPLNRFESAS